MRLCIALLLGLITIFTFPAWGQAGLEVVYDGASGVPDFLNICGDADEVAVLIRTNGLQTGTRTNLTARLQLFKGLQWQQLSIEKSSPGVTVQSVRSPGEVWLQLPDLRPGGSDVVRIVYAVSAGCELLDTLQQNNDAEVRDDWTLQFQLNGTAQETVRSPGSYRDALAIPSFSLFVDRSATPMRSGDCINRYVTLTNSALDGFVDTLRYSVVQSPGAWIKSVRVAGNTVPFRKSVTAGRDTVLEILLTGEHFATNTKDGLPGDGDGDFDPDEQLTLEEEVCLLDCTRGLSSAHTIAWG